MAQKFFNQLLHKVVALQAGVSNTTLIALEDYAVNLRGSASEAWNAVRDIYLPEHYKDFDDHLYSGTKPKKLDKPKEPDSD